MISVRGSGPKFNTLFMVMVRVMVMVINGCDIKFNMSKGTRIKLQTAEC